MTAPVVTWVVGAGGMLGGHVVERLRGQDVPVLTSAVPWTDPVGVRRSLRAGIDRLLATAGSGRWAVLWCAGAGVVATSPAALEEEAAVFAGFLDDLGVATPGRPGTVFLASSAGGVYAGSQDPPFTERTVPRPVAPYGHAKLAMERDLHAFCARTGSSALIGRISNLYGPGQKLDKPQGLVSQLCRSHVTHQPLPVYVSMDTRRDYLFVTDCADLVVGGLGRLSSKSGTEPREQVVTKILASGRCTTIASLVGESTRLFRRRPPIALGVRSEARGQMLDLRFESLVWPELDVLARTPLPVGMAATREDIARRLFRPRPAAAAAR